MAVHGCCGKGGGNNTDRSRERARHAGLPHLTKLEAACLGLETKLEKGSNGGSLVASNSTLHRPAPMHSGHTTCSDTNTPGYRCCNNTTTSWLMLATCRHTDTSIPVTHTHKSTPIEQHGYTSNTHVRHQTYKLYLLVLHLFHHHQQHPCQQSPPWADHPLLSSHEQGSCRSNAAR